MVCNSIKTQIDRPANGINNDAVLWLIRRYYDVSWHGCVSVSQGSESAPWRKIRGTNIDKCDGNGNRSIKPQSRINISHKVINRNRKQFAQHSVFALAEDDEEKDMGIAWPKDYVIAEMLCISLISTAVCKWIPCFMAAEHVYVQTTCFSSDNEDKHRNRWITNDKDRPQRPVVVSGQSRS